MNAGARTVSAPNKENKLRAISLAASLMVLAYAQSVSADTITLEGFEKPVLADQQFTYNPIGSDWIYGGTTGRGIQRNGSGWNAATAPEGKQTAFLQGGDARISKIVALTKGTYTVSFYAAMRSYDGTNANPVQVSINGVAIGNPITPTSTAFAKFTTASFPISADGNYTLELRSLNAKAGDFATFVDNVSFNSVAATTTAGMSAACTNFYAAAPNFALNASRTLTSLPTTPKTVRGVIFSDPNGTCLTRATDHTADGLSVNAHNEYSRRQAFNIDSTKQLVVAQDGYWYIYDANTHAMLKKLPGFGSDPEPQWSATDPNLLYILPNQGGNAQIYSYNVQSGALNMVGDFNARLQAIFPGTNPSVTYTKDEGSPSKDGRYWCFLVRDPVTTSGGSWTAPGVFTWDMQTDQILGSMHLVNGEVPDHVSMSPSGNYCVVSSDGPIGTAAYTTNGMNFKTQLLRDSQHSDLAIAADGRDVYVTTSYQNSDIANDGEMFFKYLDTGEKVTLIDNVYKQPDYIGAVHFSGKAFNKPGWVLLDTDADDGDGSTGAEKQPTGWMQRKVIAMQLKANPTMYTLAFTRSRYVNGGAAAPLSSVNRDFTKIAFNSNWGVLTTDVDVYDIEIPANALKELSGSATSVTQPGTTPVTSPVTTPTPALTITLGTVTHSVNSYNASYSLTTSVPAKCRSTGSSGNSYAMLSPSQNLIDSTDGLTHTKSLSLGYSGAQTTYAVCKSNNGTAEKEIAIQIK